MKKIIAYINSIIICANDKFLSFKRENIANGIDLVNALSDNLGTANTIDRFVMVYRTYRENKITVNSPMFVECLYSLASLVVNSVLKKAYNVSCNPNIEKYRSQHDLATLDDLKYCAENSTVTIYDKKGNSHREIIDKDLYNGIRDNIQNFDEKQLMIENVVSYILEYCTRLTLTEIRFCKVNKNGVEKNFLTRLGNYKRPSTKVYITDFCGVYDYAFDKGKTVDKIKMTYDRINLIQLFFLKAREYIYSNDSIIELNKKYTYLDKVVIDDNGEKIECFERQMMYTPFTNKAIFTDENVSLKNGKIHVDNTKADYELFKDIIEKMGLTDLQKTVLSYRIRFNGSYGYKAIATACGLSANSTKSALREIRNKAKNIGIEITDKTDYITDEKTPINTHFDLSVSTVDRMKYAVDHVQYIAPWFEAVNRLDFTTDIIPPTADISIICDVNNPTAKSENIVNKASVISAENVNNHRITIIDEHCKIPYLKTVVTDLSE